MPPWCLTCAPAPAPPLPRPAPAGILVRNSRTGQESDLQVSGLFFGIGEWLGGAGALPARLPAWPPTHAPQRSSWPLGTCQVSEGGTPERMLRLRARPPPPPDIPTSLMGAVPALTHASVVVLTASAPPAPTLQATPQPPPSWTASWSWTIRVTSSRSQTAAPPASQASRAWGAGGVGGEGVGGVPLASQASHTRGVRGGGVRPVAPAARPGRFPSAARPGEHQGRVRVHASWGCCGARQVGPLRAGRWPATWTPHLSSRWPAVQAARWLRSAVPHTWLTAGGAPTGCRRVCGGGRGRPQVAAGHRRRRLG